MIMFVNNGLSIFVQIETSINIINEIKCKQRFVSPTNITTNSKYILGTLHIFTIFNYERENSIFEINQRDEIIYIFSNYNLIG